MGADGALYCGRCGRRYLRRADPGHCTGCAREIGPAEARRSRAEFGRYLCDDCAERARWT